MLHFAEAVAAGDEAQAAVLAGGRIECAPDRDRLAQLLTPEPKVLMPGRLSAVARRFQEDRAEHQPDLVSEERLHDRQDVGMAVPIVPEAGVVQTELTDL